MKVHSGETERRWFVPESNDCQSRGDGGGDGGKLDHVTHHLSLYLFRTML